VKNALQRNLFLIKEHVGIFKAANNFDIHNPETGEIIMECREPSLGFFTKMLRFTDYKRMTPFDIQIRTPDGQPIVRIHRGVSIFLSKVIVSDHNNEVIGGFQQKFFSISGKFDVLNKNEQPVCQLKGKMLGWEFRFMNGDTQLAHVSKKWAGIGKELFTSADNYVLEISGSVGEDDDTRKLLLAAVMCIDMVLKE